MSNFNEHWPAELENFQIDVDQLRQFEDILMQHANEHFQAESRPSLSNITKVEQSFYSSEVPETGDSLQAYAELIDTLAIRNSVNTQRHDFVGHMTSALPDFMPVMAKLMAKLNQNTVKLETSGSITDLERQVLGQLHRIFFAPGDELTPAHDPEPEFYQQHIQSPSSVLGVFCSGGTLANLMALWVARNRFLEAFGVAELGLVRAVVNSGYKGLAVLVSERGHYSLSKAADVLGLGRQNLKAVAVDDNHRMDIAALKTEVSNLQAQGIKVLAIVGVAGATETGSIDPLASIAQVAREAGAHFHVDGAWGGAAIFSDKHKSKLAGIELADSITLDAHKQLYVPMGAGMVLFKEPELADSIKHHASYIIRPDSKDLGAYTLEGSRPAMSLLVHAGMHLIGRRGYGALIDCSVGLAERFADWLEKHDSFELLQHPQLNILVYRYVPSALRDRLEAQCSASERERINKLLNKLTVDIQVQQAAGDSSFVSRTQLHLPHYGEQHINVFRMVLANPNTSLKSLQQLAMEQVTIAQGIYPADDQTVGD